MAKITEIAIEARAEGEAPATGISYAYMGWELKRLGVRQVPLKDAKYILVSLIDLRDMPMVRRVRRTNKTAKLIVGGKGAYSAHTVGKVADAVVLGEELREERTELGPNGRIVYPTTEQCMKLIARHPWRE